MDLQRHMPQYSRLVSGTSPNFQDLFRPLEVEQLSHQGDNIRLGDGLPFPDGKWPVSVGHVLVLLWDKSMPWHPAHSFNDPFIPNAPIDQLALNHVFSVPAVLFFYIHRETALVRSS
jgi:hypothetical protein